MESLEPLSYLNNLENLKTFEMGRVNLTDSNFSYIGGLSKLTTLTIKYCNLTDVSWISSLNQLTTCDLTGCSINKGIKSFENLTLLSNLNLEDNQSLMDICADDGSVYNCCDIFANLALNHELRYLYLRGCSNLKDLSKLSSITIWKEKSGF